MGDLNVLCWINHIEYVPLEHIFWLQLHVSSSFDDFSHGDLVPFLALFSVTLVFTHLVLTTSYSILFRIVDVWFLPLYAFIPVLLGGSTTTQL